MEILIELMKQLIYRKHSYTCETQPKSILHFYTQIICTLTMIIVLARVSVSILTSTMDSYTKDIHRYAFAMVKAARSMPADLAEKLDHIKQLSFNVQLQVLRKRINIRITQKLTFYSTFRSVLLLLICKQKDQTKSLARRACETFYSIHHP